MRRDRDAIHLSAVLCEGIIYRNIRVAGTFYRFTYISISPIEPDRAHFLMERLNIILDSMIPHIPLGPVLQTQAAELSRQRWDSNTQLKNLPSRGSNYRSVCIDLCGAAAKRIVLAY